LGVKYASENSILGIIGRFISPVFAFAGFGFWQAAVALITGIFAKEIVVGTISALFSGQGADLSVILSGYFTPLSAFSFMIFSLLYTPCLPTLAVMKQEGGLKYVTLIAIYNFLIALIFATIIFQAGRLLGFK